MAPWTLGGWTTNTSDTSTDAWVTTYSTASNAISITMDSIAYSSCPPKPIPPYKQLWLIPDAMLLGVFEDDYQAWRER